MAGRRIQAGARASPQIAAPAPPPKRASRSASDRRGRDHRRVCTARKYYATAPPLPGGLPAGTPPQPQRAPAAHARGCRPDPRTGQSGLALHRQKTSLFQYHRNPGPVELIAAGRRGWGVGSGFRDADHAGMTAHGGGLYPQYTTYPVICTSLADRYWFDFLENGTHFTCGF